MRLPHIELPELNAKFLINTGSTRSFVSPELVNKFFLNYKFYEPFEVISTHTRSTHNEVIEIPMLKTFKTPGIHKFYVYTVDKKYDGLIGSDLLIQLNANIDMKNKLLKTQNTEIPILYQPPYEIRLPPRSETRVKIPTNQTKGDALLNFKDFGKGVRMPSALITCKEGFAETILQNTSAEYIIISINKPFTVEQFTPTSIPVNRVSYKNGKQNIVADALSRIKVNAMENMLIVPIVREALIQVPQIQKSQ
ncbi:unnamed protein product [Chilo suppressalis]|uniref:Peptidase A2 domain-containing protein n=1 Tax=Chilo suppressalis TaxID=168631 RepID=A0ABN8B7A7_CHISP|nr:unnamed protein product [Chilo suppressalis]